MLFPRSRLVVPMVVLVASLLSQLPAAVASAQVVAGKAAPKPALVGAAAAQIRFESVFSVGAVASPYISAPLSWSVYTGASSYRVLRAQSASTAPVAVASVPGTQYAAHVLPGNSFVFRVVALSSSGQPLDTTKSVSITTAAAPMQTLVLGSCTQNAGSFTLAWSPVANADDYSVEVELPSEIRPHRDRTPPDTLVYTFVTTPSFNTKLGGPSSHGFNSTIRANYTLRDYPTAGKVTRVSIGSATISDFEPFGTPGPCKPPPPK